MSPDIFTIFTVQSWLGTLPKTLNSQLHPQPDRGVKRMREDDIDDHSYQQDTSRRRRNPLQHRTVNSPNMTSPVKDKKGGTGAGELGKQMETRSRSKSKVGIDNATQICTTAAASPYSSAAAASNTPVVARRAAGFSTIDARMQNDYDALSPINPTKALRGRQPTPESETPNALDDGSELLPQLHRAPWPRAHLNASSLSELSASSHFPQPIQSQAHHTTVISKSTSRSRNIRSTSPVKRGFTMTDLSLGDPSIIFQSANPQLSPILPTHRELYQQVGACDQGFEVLPGLLKDDILEHCATVEAVQPHQHCFDKSNSSHGDGKQAHHQWDAVKEIANKTRLCSESEVSEASWGEEVVSKVLKAAIKFTHKERSIAYKNLTTAKVMPQYQHKHSDGCFSKKIVDYGLVLEDFKPGSRNFQHLKDRLNNFSEPTSPFSDRTTRSDDSLTRISVDVDDQTNSRPPAINHTSYNPITFHPLCISIEIKIPGGGTGILQLALWCAAHFKKLNLLVGRVVTDMALPLVSVEGSQWRVHLGVQNEDGSIRIWGQSDFGNTENVLGTYKVLAGLEVLVKWAAEVYQPWFIRHCLQGGNHVDRNMEGW